MIILFNNVEYSAEMLVNNPWLVYLCNPSRSLVNLEHVSSIEQMSDNLVLKYVERTLQCKAIDTLPDHLRQYVVTALQWSEVAKCGSVIDRARWEQAGYILDIHNEASADIYLSETTDDHNTSQIVYALIKSHGIMGQYVRGESQYRKNQPLIHLLEQGLLTADELRQILIVLNTAIISGVNCDLWNKVESEVIEAIDYLCDNKNCQHEMAWNHRLKRMIPEVFDDSDVINLLDSQDHFTNNNLVILSQDCYKKVINDHDLWYPDVALREFSLAMITTIFTIIAENDLSGIENISFYDLSRTLYYDYEGHKKINIYKKRIIEFCLNEYADTIEDLKANQHIQFICRIQGNSLFFDVQFTPVCNALINFCVEAERSGIMDYQKNITAIFDLFGFRRDIFDRLNNEEKYLATMNDAKSSRKLEILDYVVGDKIVDVGSGGGVLLDLLEENLPDKDIIGTDISANVIETLSKKIENEEHTYRVIKHNFVDGPLAEKVDTIIFSSILHEVYSYTEYEGERFNIKSVETALANAKSSLNPGGRIIIRDGVLSDELLCCDNTYNLTFKNKEGEKFLLDYMKDFKGLTTLRQEDGSWNPSLVNYHGDGLLSANINFIREFLYTYTWGIESYSCEVNEQFGYYTLDNYKNLLSSMGLKIIKGEAYLEQGYPDNLNKLVVLGEGLTWEMMPSNCIIVGEN